ncbi:hypothetical protein CPB83DRAFT_900503 [Crepidotus variabilis]|uniref:Uncharacterized protein n=1 Tax=Crepidotus variabilis TaxID=179855 RepID=A0A9P6E333_9AGAR|nr:hypothetical protein CPB83DRAFT_900503 [Crepidotus variabilis]
MSSCIEQLAGFRTALLSVGIDLAVYLQAYLSDKTQTYHIGGGINFRALSIMMALHGNPPIFCRNLLQVLQDASAVLDVLLRIEMRVPLRRAPLALQQFRRTTLAISIASFPRRVWWDYKQTRLFAATYLLSYLNTQTLTIRRRESTEVMVFGLTFLINALSHRLDDDSSARDLIRCIAPLTNDIALSTLMRRNADANSQLARYPEGYPWIPGGIFILRDFSLPPVSDPPRFYHVTEVSSGTYFYFANCTREQAGRKLYKQYYKEQAPGAKWVPQRKGMTVARNQQPREFDLAPQEGAIIRLPMFDHVNLDGTAEIQQDNESLSEAPVERDEPSMGDSLRTILDQMASDWMQKLGNASKSKSSYCFITQPHRQYINVADLNSLNLERFFQQVQYRRVSPEQWNKIIDVLIWEYNKPMPKSNTQQPLCLYHGMYLSLMDGAPPGMRDSIRATLQGELRKMPWLPYSRSDRIWIYETEPRSNEGPFRAIPHSKNGGPRIAINPKTIGHPSWVPSAQNVADIEELRREIEESSDAEDVAPMIVSGAIPFGAQPTQQFIGELLSQPGRGRFMVDHE